MNFYILLTKLMKRKLPKSLISLLHMWFCCSVFVVKWQGMLSNTFEIHCGVRQGGVLSPFFFAIYVDDLLDMLHSSRPGCHVNGICVNSFMFADDLIILSASLFDMQKLLNLCSCELEDISLRINLKKCACVRIGKRFNMHCEQLYVAQGLIAFVDQIRYLGVYIKTGHTLKFYTDPSKGKFYWCMNELLHEVGSRETVAIDLCNSYCVTMLLYAVEAMNLTKTERLRLSSTFNRLFSKLFKSFDRSVVGYNSVSIICLVCHWTM